MCIRDSDIAGTGESKDLLDDFAGGFAEDSGGGNPLESGIITMLQTDEDEKVWCDLISSFRFFIFSPPCFHV